MPRRNDSQESHSENDWHGARREDGRRGYGTRKEAPREDDGRRGYGTRKEAPREDDGRRGYGTRKEASRDDGRRGYGTRKDAPREDDGRRGYGTRKEAPREDDGRRGYGTRKDAPREDEGRRGYGTRKDAVRIARKGDRLQIHYTCFDEDGKKLESTHDGGPAPTIRLGGGDVLKALEKAFTGMAAGERKTVTLEPKDAFPYDEDLVTEITPDKWQLDEPPKVGMTIDVLDAPDDIADEDVNEDDIMQGVVTEILNDGTAIVDCNHPLADKTLTFELELVKIL
ncbi:MAG: FKBP-type peptidyl-prolyl cis-trans isomerase [Lentisphaeria bacterium]|nr:FKBP-type peptidyl-prolyl cis-trans isomerase [Lentisphaeria bacterium]